MGDAQCSGLGTISIETHHLLQEGLTAEDELVLQRVLGGGGPAAVSPYYDGGMARPGVPHPQPQYNTPPPNMLPSPGQLGGGGGNYPLRGLGACVTCLVTQLSLSPVNLLEQTIECVKPHATIYGIG